MPVPAAAVVIPAMMAPFLFCAPFQDYLMEKFMYAPPKSYNSRKLVTTGGDPLVHSAPLECSPISASYQNLTWILACELLYGPKPTNNAFDFESTTTTLPFARAVLKFQPRLALRISLVRGTDKQMRITTAEANALLNDHHHHDNFDSSPNLLVLPMATQEEGNDEQLLSIPRVPTLIGTASFTVSQLKVGKKIASTFLQYHKNT